MWLDDQSRHFFPTSLEAPGPEALAELLVVRLGEEAGRQAWKGEILSWGMHVLAPWPRHCGHEAGI